MVHAARWRMRKGSRPERAGSSGMGGTMFTLVILHRDLTIGLSIAARPRARPALSVCQGHRQRFVECTSGASS